MSVPHDQQRQVLPHFVRYHDLVAAGIVRNWPTLLRLIETEGFPAGVLLGPNTRVWKAADVEHWLAARPTARKALPEVTRRRALVGDGTEVAR
jgi:predicted DNA-binding transcriptional regulator AlpA